MVLISDAVLVGEWMASPSTQNRCDHGRIAVTGTGWVCRAWTHGLTDKSVSCRVGQLIPGKTVEDDVFQPVGASIAIATPGANESCEKAWVCPLSPTEFVVTWERQNSSSATAKIECARVYLSEGAWTVDQASAGAGHVLDQTGVVQGDADCNCRALYVEDGYFFISYSTETANSGTAPHERTYTLRTGLLSWLASGAPTSEATKTYSGLHWDDADATPTTAGGYLLSTSCVTVRGDILLAWEDRDWNGSAYVNAIKLRRLSGLYAASPLTELATTDTLFTLTDDNSAYRRPQLASIHPASHRAASTAAGASRILLTYGLEDIDTPGNSAAKMAVLSQYYGTLARTDLTWTANFGQNTTLDKMSSATAIMSPSIEVGIANANFDGDNGRYFSVQHTNGDHEALRGIPRWIDRPFGETWCWKGREYLFLSYEGNEDGDADNSLTYAACWRLK